MSSQYDQLNSSVQAYRVRKVDRVLQSSTTLANINAVTDCHSFLYIFFYAKSHQSYEISPIRLIKSSSWQEREPWVLHSEVQKENHNTKNASARFIISSTRGCRAQLISEEFLCIAGPGKKFYAWENFSSTGKISSELKI